MLKKTVTKKRRVSRKQATKEKVVTMLEERKKERKQEEKFYWPDCPDCGDTDWNPKFHWRGNVTTTTMSCTCGFVGLAIDLLDAAHVWMYGAPIK